MLKKIINWIVKLMIYVKHVSVLQNNFVIIQYFIPEPLSKTGVHSSSSSVLHPDPAPENTRSSITPGNPDAGVCL